MEEQLHIEIIRADITKMAVDAIVNAANTRLLGGGGVDGAIHRAAGKELMEACRSIPEITPGVRCPTGEARMTLGFDLPARYVIHTVGPVWQGGDHGEDGLLASCYRNSMALARENGVRSLAFPSISTGVYSFPFKRAARIAYEEISNALSDDEVVEKVWFVCFSSSDLQVFSSMVSSEGI